MRGYAAGMLTFAEAHAPAVPAADHAEVTRLLALGTPGVIVPPAFEEAFYRGGNLPEQLRRLFSKVRPARIDEDALEPLAAQAQALIRTSYLMDDAVQAFYRTLARASFPAGAVVRVRRPDATLGEDAPFLAPGTATLQAMKRVWAQDWTFDAVLERLDSAGSVALEARSTLLHPA
ncbi:hypothetical protein DEIGR_102539 [Deinococcus grandis]|uniref:Uncharacterized protein n=2 Tax=Deinococcus grandis TaxID=57498 RepID=A0A117DNY7_9DEIO|nr:hypothetical protein DEGR_07130 [Deinococcus grandis]GAQ22512.1 hypothetical protein DEIGR_102539 [Deinococcus grandis]